MSEQKKIVKFPNRPHASPVDYEAWKRGYMPPSEHLLIHELTYEGAKVIGKSGFDGNEYWLVAKGQPFSDAFAINMFLMDQLLEMAKDHKEQRRAAVTAFKFLKALSLTPLKTLQRRK